MTDARKVNTFGGSSSSEVSHQWFARPADQKFLSLSTLREFKAKEYSESLTTICPSKKIEVLAPEPTDKASLRALSFGLPNGDEVNSTHWAFGQLCSLAKAPASYLRELPSQIVADNLSYGLRHLREVEDVKVYSRKNGEHTLRAVTGPDYGRVPDYEVVQALQGIAGNGNGDTRWKVPGTLDWSTGVYDPNTPVSLDTTTLYASDRDLFCFLVDDRNPVQVGTFTDPRTGKEEPDLLFRGFYVTNSEVGKGALKIVGFYLRAVCCNRILWGVEHREEINIRHSKGAPERFVDQAQPALLAYAEGSAKGLIEGVQKAKAAKVASDDDEAIEFLKNRGLSKQRARKVLDICEVEEGHKPRSAWDIAQGITALARSIPNTDDRLDLEVVAGKVLDKAAA